MIQVKNQEDCCGCTACASICNHKAITMKPDTFGFLYPLVDINKCVNCGLCDNICAFNPKYDTSLNFTKPIVYGARHKDIREVLNSRSGALFVAISDYILEQGGVVYGVGFKDHFRVVHKRAETKIERDEFRGSKYVQSDLRGIFPQIRQDLKNGKNVLFVGTACQTSGLNSFIGKKLRKNLLLIDIVCHGVPGPYLWQDYILYLENKYGNKLIKVNFRDKIEFGWDSHKETYIFNDCPNKVSVNTNFYRSEFFRKSCGKCYFCNTRRPSDITIADFWGWEKQNIDLNKDNMGINLVLVNTKYGNSILEQIKDSINYFIVKDKSYLQPNLRRATPNHPYRNIIEKDYLKKGFKYSFFHDYNNPSFKDKIRKLISKIGIDI